MMLLTAGLFIACQSEIDTKPAADVKEVSAETKKPNPMASKKLVKKPAPGAKLTPAGMDPNALPLSDSSKVEFIGAKVTGDHRGGFKTVKGGASVGDDGKITAVNLEIDMTSVYADSFASAEKFVSHLKDEDFFTSKNTPQPVSKVPRLKEPR